MHAKRIKNEIKRRTQTTKIEKFGVDGEFYPTDNYMHTPSRARERERASLSMEAQRWTGENVERNIVHEIVYDVRQRPRRRRTWRASPNTKTRKTRNKIDSERKRKRRRRKTKLLDHQKGVSVDANRPFLVSTNSALCSTSEHQIHFYFVIFLSSFIANDGVENRFSAFADIVQVNCAHVCACSFVRVVVFRHRTANHTNKNESRRDVKLLFCSEGVFAIVVSLGLLALMRTSTSSSFLAVLLISCHDDTIQLKLLAHISRRFEIPFLFVVDFDDIFSSCENLRYAQMKH